MNLPVSGFVAEIAHPNQRGFVRGRHILDNVVQLESEALIASSTSTTTPLMLAFDLEAAFPSVYHRFMWAVLKQYGIPRSFRNVLKGLYNDHKVQIRLGGILYKGFKFRCGIKQGCPVSGSLFALLMDLLFGICCVEFHDPRGSSWHSLTI